MKMCLVVFVCTAILLAIRSIERLNEQNFHMHIHRHNYLKQ